MGLSGSPGGEIPTRGRPGAPLTRRRASGSVVSMIEIGALTKRYGRTTAVSDLTFTVRPGVVTGFLGPNGAGKSTTMRMILGLDEPTSGSVTVNGRPPRAHTAPLRELGGMLDPRAVHPSRSAYHHLLALAQTSGIRRSRVDEVIDAVGLRSVAGRRAGGFSLGMAQRRQRGVHPLDRDRAVPGEAEPPQLTEHRVGGAVAEVEMDGVTLGAADGRAQHHEVLHAARRREPLDQRAGQAGRAHHPHPQHHEPASPDRGSIVVWSVVIANPPFPVVPRTVCS